MRRVFTALSHPRLIDWGLRDYSCPEVALEDGWTGQFGLEETPDRYIAHSLQFLRALWRVLRKDGTLWLNLGDSYAGSGKGQMGDGRHAAKCGEKQKTNVGTTIGGLPTSYDGLKPKDLVMIPFRVALAAQADGWYLRSVIIWHKPNPMPESVRDRPTTSHEYVLLMAKSKKYYYDADAIRESSVYPNDNRKARSSIDQKRMPTDQIAGVRPGSATYPRRNKRTVWTISTKPYKGPHYSTFPPDLIEPMILAGTSPKVCAECGAPWERVVEYDRTQADRRYRDWRTAGWPKDDQGRAVMTGNPVQCTNPRAPGVTTLGWRPTCSCDAATKRATVLDPFCGTATVAQKCIEHGRDYVMIDIDPKSIEMAEERIAQVQIRLPLLDTDHDQ